ncbi:MAG TPA: lipid II flippase MurJ [Terracidiphilus sp.]|jgi:putative peptidoglycan lipid II flippase
MRGATEIARPINTNRRVLGAVSAVAFAGIVVKLAAALKEFTVAGVYGRSDAYEAFLTAALVPALLVNLVSESMSQALVPTFVRVREQEGRGRAQQLLSNVLISTTALIGIFVFGSAGLARWLFPLIGSHFSAAKLDLSVHLFYGLLPVVFLASAASNCTAVLNTAGRFGLPALAPIAGSLAVIAAISFGTDPGIWAMVYATLAGALTQLLWVGVMTHASGYRFSLRWYGLNEATIEVARQYGPLLLSGVVASGGLLVDQAMAAMLPAGSVAALAYGGRFVSVVLALLGGSVASAVTPIFAEMVVHGDWEGCRKTLRRWALVSGGAAAFVAFALIISSHMLVRLTFQHGVFGLQDSAAVSWVLEMYAIQIPFFVCSRVFYRFLIAMRRTDLVFYCGLVNLVLDIILNLLLMRRMGVAGIALATSLWTVSTLAFLGYWSWRLLPQRDDRRAA